MIKKINVKHLRVGMYIAAANDHWIPSGNQSRSGMLSKRSTLDKIQRLNIEFVFIDTSKGLDSDMAEPVADEDEVAAMEANVAEEIPPTSEQERAIYRQQKQSGVTSPSTAAVPLSEERQRAAEIHSEALSMVGDIMTQVQKGADIDVQALDQMTDDIVDSLARNANGLACMTRIREKNAYLLEHSLNVGVLLGLFAQFQGFPRREIKALTMGGILHDIGKINVPDEVLNKPGKLSSEEWQEMKNHVIYGFDYLNRLGGMDPIVLSVCRQHHERVDGTGYPSGLTAGSIDEYGRMAAICDVYDAITADRVYHKGMAPDRAMKNLVEWSNDHLDRAMVYNFIRCMSIYPVGTIVALDSGRAGVVVEPNPIKQSQPKVRIMYDLNADSFLNPILVDLSTQVGLDRIHKALEPSSLPARVNLMEFI